MGGERSRPAFGMHITIKLFATLREGRFNEQVRECAEGVTAGRVMKDLAIPEEQVTLIFINGVHGDPGSRLREGDTLSLFPPVGGG